MKAGTIEIHFSQIEPTTQTSKNLALSWIFLVEIFPNSARNYLKRI